MAFSQHAMDVNFNESQQLWSSFMCNICQKIILMLSAYVIYMDYFIKTRNWTYFREINNSYYTYHFHEVYVMFCTQFCLCKCWILHTSKCLSVVSDSLQRMDYIVHEIIQARIPEGVAFPFSRGSSQPRDRNQVSCIAGGFFTSSATRETEKYWSG